MVNVFFLLRTGGLIAGAFAVERLLKNKGDIEKTLEEFTSELEELKERFDLKESGFFPTAMKLARGEFVDLVSLVRLATDVRMAYAAIPSSVKRNLPKTFNLEHYIDSVLREASESEGLRMLNEKVFDDRPLTKHLQRQYIGLYLIGLNGTTLSAEERSAICERLLALHQQLAREGDQLLINWFIDPTSPKVSSPSLTGRLGACPEIEELPVNHAYIAHALGQQNLELIFDQIQAGLAPILKLL